MFFLESRHFVLLKLNRKLDDITICNMKEVLKIMDI